MPEILPHPFRGSVNPATERIIPVTITIDRAIEIPENEFVLPFVTSTGDEDRHGSRIDPNGWDDSFYRQNPVVLWSHQTLIPAIGKAEGIKRSAQKGTCNVRFAIEAWRAEGMGNLAQQVYQLCRDGFINMGSESFIPKKWREMEATTIPSFFAENVFYERVEKTEFSIVNVGSNRGALQIRSLLEKGSISENEANLLGLGMMLKFETPIEIRTTPPAAPPADEAKRIATVGEFRGMVGNLLRCCGCYPAEPPAPEVISDEAKALEVETLNVIATEALEALDTGIRGWKGAQRDDFRWFCRDRVTSAMWAFEIAAMYLKNWHGQDVGATIPDINFDDVERSIEGADFSRVGKVFSAKNLKKIDDIIALATDLRAAADAANGDEPMDDEERSTSPIIRISGVESPEQDSKAILRVLVPDTSRDRSDESPAPGDLYRVMLTQGD